MKQVITILFFLLWACAPIFSQTQSAVRVKCGGPSYTDTKGQVWQADTDYTGGVVTKTAARITGTADPTLYQTARRNQANAAVLLYNLPVANGTYHVNLYLAETSSAMFQVGGRVFNVKMQGNPVFTDLDIFAEAGSDAALIKGADVSVSNGVLNIEFDNVVSQAKVSAIEVLPGSWGPAMTLSFKYPDGTPVAGTLAYAVTSSLLSFQGSAALTAGSAQCVLFANPSALGISTQFQVTLSLTDTAGHVLWQMNLGMDPSQINLGAIQSSELDVIVQKQ
ncbi:MAG TPA: malectin [Candidatus Acidoferrum sp.]|nr:malectin [Candidatus Acidoferrum sp.]